MHLALNDYVVTEPLFSREGEKKFLAPAHIEQIGSAPPEGWLTDFFVGTAAGSVETTLQRALQRGLTVRVARSWAKYLFDPDAASDIDALSNTVDKVFQVVADLGPEAIDLRGLEAGSVHPEHLAAVLRALSSWRDEVPGWQHALRVAEEALSNAGLDPADALYGMI